MSVPAEDPWARWFASRRHAGDDAVRLRMLREHLLPVRDRVLDGAGPLTGARVLDAGCGDGLIAFGALERGAASVVFADISAELLDVCRGAAAELGVAERCRFAQAPVEELAPVESGSIDVATVRSVLIYVERKDAAFAELARTLRPGGRLSLFEPINRFARADWSEGRLMGIDVSAVEPLAARVRAVYRAIQPLASDPMLDFDERDLLRLAEAAGFHPIELELRAEVRDAEPVAFETFLHSAGNPRIPTLAEAMAQALSPAEQARLVEQLRPQVEAGTGSRRMAVAYLRAGRGEE